ncbi:hypothetical protein DPMN_114006 [Dreissena polymorpha]|uniref:Uncharacterized protein n=1 Tax=Dreissena polymorpha TaxID=45954 RepID=A0A9D4QR65_DREPO|nr:hypothetical protein DPMN_114006 [Dreissena polymorpha]
MFAFKVVCQAQSQPTNGAFVMATDGSTTVGTFSCELGYSLRNVTMATSSVAVMDHGM